MFTLIEWAREAHAEYCRNRAARAIRESLGELDDRVLHDLGLDRSEIDSAAAEATGRAESTRSLHFRI